MEKKTNSQVIEAIEALLNELKEARYNARGNAELNECDAVFIAALKQVMSTLPAEEHKSTVSPYEKFVTIATIVKDTERRLAPVFSDDRAYSVEWCDSVRKYNVVVLNRTLEAIAAEVAR